MKNLSFIFFGTPDFAVPALDIFVSRGHKVSVVTAPDNPLGKKGIPAPSPVKSRALELGLTLYQPANLKDEAFVRTLKDRSPDLGIVAAYGKILPEKILAIPKHGFIVIHPSLLPKYRGPSPVQSAILEGQTETGVTLMVPDAEIDHGPVLAEKSMSIPNSAYHTEVASVLFNLGAKLLLEILPKYTAGELRATPQNHTEATFTKKFNHTDGKINWTQPAEKIYNQIRALNPNPGTWTTWNGKKIRVLKATPQSGAKNLKPGAIFKTGLDIAIQTGINQLTLDTVQLEGSKPMSVKDFANGHKNFTGSHVI